MIKSFRKNIIEKKLATGHDPLLMEDKRNNYHEFSIGHESDYIIPDPIYDSALI